MVNALKIEGFTVKNEIPVYANLNEKKKAEQAAIKFIGISCSKLQNNMVVGSREK